LAVPGTRPTGITSARVCREWSHSLGKILALSFLLLIGVTLIAEGLGQHIAKGYVYFAMAFSVFVEALNLRAKKGRGAESALHSGIPFEQRSFLAAV
jgi:hypothetical protein